jgi:hypothetical protein
MSLIVDINPVPWEILDLVKARILKNRANRQKRQPEKPGELRRVMQVDNGLLAKQRWEEPSFILENIVKSIVIEYSMPPSSTPGLSIDTLTSMIEPVVDGPQGREIRRARDLKGKYIVWGGDNETETITLGRTKWMEAFYPKDFNTMDTFLKDYPNAEFVKFSLAANYYHALGNEVIVVIVKVKVNVDEPDETTILEQVKMVPLVLEGWLGGISQSLGILKIYLDRYYAEFE